MKSALSAINFRRFAGIAFGAGAFALAACQSPTGFGTNPSSLRGLRNYIADTGPTYSFGPYTVGNENSAITGINNDSHSTTIVGVHWGSGTHGDYQSFTARVIPSANPTPTCNTIGFTCPTADPPSSPPNVYINEISEVRNSSGYSFSVGYSPPITGSSSCKSQYCGLIYNPKNSAGVSEVQAPNASGTCAATFLYGTSDPEVQVGYYQTGSTSNCTSHAFEEYHDPSGKPQFFDFHFPSSLGYVTNSMAYGINNKGDVVGAFTIGTSPIEFGWEYRNFCYYTFQFTATGSKYSTQARGINWDGIIVGSYAAGGTLNGFVQSGGTLYQVNDGANGTVINNISNFKTIVGYHLGGGTHHYEMGFVGTCGNNSSSSTCPAKPAVLSSCALGGSAREVGHPTTGADSRHSTLTRGMKGDR